MSDTGEKTQTNEAPQAAANRGDLATFSRPRIAYHPAIQERFGVDQAGWRALTDAIWPAAKTADAVVLALSYCKARNLDPFKRPVHIVPVWSKEAGRLIESVWPGIGELRTTAFRTGLYAGRDQPEYGPDVEETLDGVKMRYPEWCAITVYRLSKSGERMPYPGPRVYWAETYATAKRDTTAPNEMWRRRPHGQIEKCAEAAALRAAFPEELGNDYTAEEMAGQVIDPDGNVERGNAPVVVDKKQSNLERFETRHAPVTDVADYFEVVNILGNVIQYHDASDAVAAYQEALDVAEKARGESGLTTVWDNNQPFMNQLDERGPPDLSKELSLEYGKRREAAAAREEHKVPHGTGGAPVSDAGHDTVSDNEVRGAAPVADRPGASGSTQLAGTQEHPGENLPPDGQETPQAGSRQPERDGHTASASPAGGDLLGGGEKKPRSYAERRG